ncbi:MAG: alpha/beta hydrolase [Chloroflexi bacterium]|nr:alpha/beta hydrolase [Chloroflexota bacterium]MYD49526.1 alpha/beta hydrolase [Chloroflexota bacterium]
MSGIWSVPEPAEILAVDVANGARTQVRRHGNPGGPRLILSHGCGLAADTYLPYWSLLQDCVDLLVFDFRSHGWNQEGSPASLNFPIFADDCEAILAAIEERFGPKPIVGVFHSMSALAALLFEQTRGGFAGLVLFDPPIQQPGRNPEDLVYVADHMNRSVRRRRERFESHGDFIGYIEAAPAFQRLCQGMPALMAETLLRPDGEGYALRCPLEHEALIYRFFYGWSMEIDTNQIRCPLKVVGSDPTTSFTFMPSSDFNELVRMGYDFLPEATHLIQLEEPEECAEITLQFLEETGFL